VLGGGHLVHWAWLSLEAFVQFAQENGRDDLHLNYFTAGDFVHQGLSIDQDNFGLFNDIPFHGTGRSNSLVDHAGGDPCR
jgi:hypothetical protein